MNGRVIRYKKPEWKNWSVITVADSLYDATVANLKSLGYEVEGE